MIYAAHDSFVGPARARPELWRLIVGLVLALLIYLLIIGVLWGVLVATLGMAEVTAIMGDLMHVGTAEGALFLLATFIGMGLGPMVAVRLLHKRSIASLFGLRAGFLRNFAVAAAVCGGVYLVVHLIPTETDLTPGVDPAIWVLYLAPALLLILIQTGAEEVLFRGYIQQQLAARYASPLIWMVLPSALFAMGHYQPQIMGESAWLVVGAAFLFGVLAADLTAKTGSIAAAWGFHFANNTFAILIVTMEGPLSGLALQTIPMEALASVDFQPLLLIDIALTLAIWFVIRWIVSRTARPM